MYSNTLPDAIKRRRVNGHSSGNNNSMSISSTSQYHSTNQSTSATVLTAQQLRQIRISKFSPSTHTSSTHTHTVNTSQTPSNTQPASTVISSSVPRTTPQTHTTGTSTALHTHTHTHTTHKNTQNTSKPHSDTKSTVTKTTPQTRSHSTTSTKPLTNDVKIAMWTHETISCIFQVTTNNAVKHAVNVDREHKQRNAREGKLVVLPGFDGNRFTTGQIDVIIFERLRMNPTIRSFSPLTYLLSCYVRCSLLLKTACWDGVCVCVCVCVCVYMCVVHTCVCFSCVCVCI